MTKLFVDVATREKGLVKGGLRLMGETHVRFFKRLFQKLISGKEN
jgi:hypothetical protein